MANYGQGSFGYVSGILTPGITPPAGKAYYWRSSKLVEGFSSVPQLVLQVLPLRIIGGSYSFQLILLMTVLPGPPTAPITLYRCYDMTEQKDSIKPDSEG